MKTSKKIIIAYCIFIIGGMLILFIDAKHHKKDPLFRDISEKEIQLSPFSVIVAGEGVKFNVAQSDSYKLTFENKKNNLKFVIKNDTLFLIGNAFKTTVNCKDIKSIITTEKSWVVIEKIHSDSLQIIARGGNLFVELPEENPSKMTSLSIYSRNNALVRINNLLVNNLSINSINSQVEIYCAVNSLQCKLSNSSKFFIYPNPTVLKMERDSTSGITMYP